MKFRYLAALLLLLPFSQMAKADLCADPTTHAYKTCATASNSSGVTYYDTSTVPPNALFYVTAYGAKCNGATDGSDTAGIQAAVTAAGVSGGAVIVTGKCSFNNTATITSSDTAPVSIVGVGGATMTPVARASWLGTVSAQAFILATNASSVTIEGLNFQYSSDYNGSCHIIEVFSTNSKVLVQNNIGNYCGNLISDIGATDVTVTGNRYYNAQTAGVGIWNGATGVKVTNNYISVAGNGSYGIEFTGETTALTAATSTDIVETGNTIHLLGLSEVGINVDGMTAGCSGVAGEFHGTIADNHIYTNPGVQGYGILLRYCASYWDIHDNIIISDGTDMQSPAIMAYSQIGPGIKIHDNIVYNWNNQNGGTVKGLFGNTSVGGTVAFNECYSCTTATTLVGNTDATTQIFGNDTGTGSITFTDITATGNIEAGASGQFDWTGRGILTSPSSGFIQLGAANAASPVDYTLAVQSARSGTDTDTAGGNLTLASGRGTGNATGSTLTFSTPHATSTGTGSQTYLPGIVLSDGVVTIGGAVKLGARLYASSTIPTIASGFNTSGSTLTGVTTAAFQVTVGTSTATSTGVLTMPTATTGWHCSVSNDTNGATSMVQQTANTTTSVTVTNFVRTTGVAGNFTNSDKLTFTCGAF